MSYDPKPIDNSKVELSSDLNQLIETLARNNHDLWAQGRIAEGWRYGPVRDAEKKETPLLVSYDELPDSEKAYDRQNAVETLKSIVHFGGNVEVPAQAPRTLDENIAVARQASKTSQSLLAFDVAQEGLTFWPKDSTLIQIKALALARMGSPELARDLLNGLPAAAADDQETAGILARTYKDIWLRTGDGTDLDNAIEHYLAAYRSRPERYWTGINAATLYWAAGDAANATSLAATIHRDCLRQLENASGDDKYWLPATIAEAALIAAASRNPEVSETDLREAERFYRHAREVAASNFGDVFSTWRNARIILRHLPAGVADRIEGALKVPRVAVFAGHRSYAASTHDLKTAIRDILLNLNVGVGFSSAAAGSDILFLETLQELGGQTVIVLPCKQEEFIRESVAESGGEWAGRFKAVVSKAEETIVTSDQQLVFGDVAYQYAGNVMDGLAIMRAGQFETSLLHIAVWDGQPGGGPGGTYDTVRRWQAAGHDVHVIDPQDVKDGRENPVRRIAASGAVAPPPQSGPVGTAMGFVPEIRAMMFGDVKHFSQLNDRQMLGFLRDFIGPVAAMARNSAPLFQNTWGDGFFFVFAKVEDAARFALGLRDRVAAIDRKVAGLPDGMTMRIALHAGPVFRFEDQFIRKSNYIGSHVNRAARVEPVTLPGRIYATESFAALATLEAPGQFRFDYVGKVPLAKDFGRFSLYDVSRGQ